MKPHRGRQSGAALLALVFVVIAASAYLLVLRLNAATRPYQREQRTVAGLNEAKQALIAYALSFPDLSGTTDPTAGPGYLPCPDTDNDGSPNPPCGGPVALGRFPGEWLDVSDYEDNAGERFWYALSGNYRNNPKLQPLNSDTPGQLSVAGVTDVVAVIFAPGSPTEAQTGRPSSAINDYLEGENADGDTEFSANAGGNDRLIYITRQELMAVIEKRVLGEIANALKKYRQSAGVYPWLNNFDPLATDYDAVTSVREGYLAFNEINEVFSTRFSVSWDIRAGGDGDPFTLTPTTTMPDWNSFSPIGVDMVSVFYDLDASVAGPECGWIARDAINCVGRAQDPDPVTLQVTVFGIPVLSVSGTRYYDFDIAIPSGGTPSVCVYTACPGTIRNRDVNLAADPINGFPPGTKGEVTITDSGTIDTCLPIAWWWCLTLDPITFLDDGTLPTEACLTDFGMCFPLVVVNGGSATNVITTATDADVDIYETTFDLGVGDEIPLWLTANNWHKLTLVAYSAGDAPDNTGPCIPAGIPACLTLNGVVAPMDNKRALVISASVDLTASRPSANPTDYFELGNATPGDDIFNKQAKTNSFNDQVKVLQ